ncbi:MAG: hypothetical protein ACE5EE_09360 [Fidelibacterota bacterium]
MNRNNLLELIQAGDLDAIERYLNHFVINPESLRKYLQYLLVLSSPSTHFQWREECGWLHPIVVLNAIKNICGSRIENPSFPLLKYATSLKGFPDKVPLQGTWPQISEEERIKPLFIMDFRTALAAKDFDAALFEAAKIKLMSENKTYVLEIICDAFLDQFATVGLLSYSFYRAGAFCPQEDVQHFVFSLLEFLLSPASTSSSFPETDSSLPAVYAAIHRLQNTGSVLENSFSKVELSEFKIPPGNSVAPEIAQSALRGNDIYEAWTGSDPETLGILMQDITLSGDKSWPLQLVEKRLLNGEEINPFWLVKLDTVQYLLRVDAGWGAVDLAFYLLQ